MKIKQILLAVALSVLTMTAVQARAARDYISIVGSSTVYPFSTVVAEQFGRTTRYKTPKVESTGTGGGFKLFCGGVDLDTPDISNASRRIKKSEFAKCQANGVTDIIEVKIGYDGIVLAISRKNAPMHLTRKDIFLALAQNVPDPDGTETLIPNPFKTWQDVNPLLPARKIEVLGPPPTSGTRDAFVELAMEGGAKEFPWIKSLKKQNKNVYKSICHTLREDGCYIEAGENDNLIVQKLVANPDAVGIFGFSFLDQNSAVIQGAVIEGHTPSFEEIAAGSYPVSRPLYFYVKKAHVNVIAGMREFLAEFTADKAWGEDGYLADKGMIPMPDTERKKIAVAVEKLTNMTEPK